ncbi:MAG: lysophospholipid acyltransferase family protein [bacterium]
MIRSTIIYILVILITMIISTAIVFVSLIDWTEGKLSFFLTRIWAKLILFISGVRVEVIGKENVIQDGPQVFASNHQSAYDIFVLLATIKIQFKWIARKEFFRVPFLGWAMTSTRQIGLDRENRTKAYDSINQAVTKIRSGTSIVIFPEGTRTMDGSVSEFKRGGLLLATRAEVPIIPTTIIGAYNILPKGGFKINPTQVRIVFDKPIDTKGIDKTTQKKLINKLRETIVQTSLDIFPK